MLTGEICIFILLFLLFLEYNLGFGVLDLVGSGKIISPVKENILENDFVPLSEGERWGIAILAYQNIKPH